MLIIKPPAPVVGAVNLSKGAEVFKVAANMAEDTILELGPRPNPYYMLTGVHSYQYVSDIISGRTANGYGSLSVLENQHSTNSCASMEFAAEIVTGQSYIKGHSPVFVPVSGFHHAGHAYGGGYCTFNGLMVAARVAMKMRSDARVLIIDGDGHFGDGTDDIIKKLEMQENVAHCSLSKSEVQGDADYAQQKLVKALDSEYWDLVLYQAGADSHIDDPYESGYLNDMQWENRDAAVFSICRDRELPLVFNLAGGYNGKKTTLLHHSTVSTARRVYYGRQRAHLSPLPSP